MAMLLVVVIGVGTLYGIIQEDWNFIQSFYWSIVTLTTVGYGDFTPQSQSSRLISSFYIIFSTGIFAAIVTATIASYLDIRKKGEVIRHLLRPLTPMRVAMMDKDNDGEITQKEFLDWSSTHIVRHLTGACGYCFGICRSGLSQVPFPMLTNARFRR